MFLLLKSLNSHFYTTSSVVIGAFFELFQIKPNLIYKQQTFQVACSLVQN